MVQPFGKEGIWIPQDYTDKVSMIQPENYFNHYEFYKEELGENFLEEYYQTKLYTYKKRVFRLTKAGEILYEYARTFSSDSERIREQLPLIASQSQKLRLGAERCAGESFLSYLNPILIIK